MIDHHPAFAAKAFFAAIGSEQDPFGKRGLEQGGAGRYSDPAAKRIKHDITGLSHGFFTGVLIKI
jgi:hypothetical protein